MRTRWNRQRIALAQDGCRTVAVEADVFGAWGVCLVPSDLATLFIWGWEVVHIPTGKALVGDIQNKQVARAICRRVDDLTVWAAYPDGRPDPVTVEGMYRVIESEKRRHARRVAVRYLARTCRRTDR